MTDPVHERFLCCLTPALSDLRAFIAACIRDPGGRDDVLQEVTLVLWRRFSTYDDSKPFGAWARGVAKNVLHAWWRQSQRLHSLDPQAIDALADVADVWDEPPVGRERELDALRQCLADVQGQQRRWLELRYSEGLDCAAVAARLGSTATAVQRSLHRLRERLADCVRRRLMSHVES